MKSASLCLFNKATFSYKAFGASVSSLSTKQINSPRAISSASFEAFEICPLINLVLTTIRVSLFSYSFNVLVVSRFVEQSSTIHTS